jgi:VanZ family protein
MNASRAPHPATKFLLQYHVELLTAFAFLFILQSGTVPFDFTADTLALRVRHFFDASVSTFTYPDAVSNVFLYVPLGVLLHWSLCRARMSRVTAMLTTIGVAGLLSGGIEWLQAYSPSRVSSLIDLVCNLIGASMGASVSSVARGIVPRVIGGVMFEFHERPAAAVVKSYCGLLVVCATLPFSFSFDASQLKKAVQTSTFVPFGTSEAHRSLQEQADAGGDARTKALARWETMSRWSRWTAEAVSFAVLALLLEALLRSDYGFGRRAAAALVWWLCGLFAVTLSVLQFPVVSRGSDVTDILFRLLGVGLSLVAKSVYVRHRGGSDDVALGQSGRTLAGVGCAATFAFIVYTGIVPFTFAYPKGGVCGPLTATEFLPFMAYFVTRFDLMMTDVMEKFASYAVLAALLATCRTRLAQWDMWPRLIRVMTVCIALSSLIECVQMFIPIRVVSLTDPILAAAGCIVGVIVQERAVRFYRFSVAEEVLGPDDHPATPEQMRSLTITDSLIASLADPSADAPTETSPAPSRK